MIFIPLELLGGTILGLFTFMFGSLGWSFPASITTSIVVLLNVLHTFSSFLPFISTIVAIGLIIIPAKVIRYIIDAILWAWGMIPVIGTHSRVPQGHPLDLRRQAPPGVLDLRKQQPPHRKTMADIVRRGE